MPASRNALAMTFAPRSCPSSPGLATSTRTLISAIEHHLTTEDTEDHRGNQKSAHFYFYCYASRRLNGFDIQTSPQVPASHAAVWLPCARDLLHIFRLRQFAFFVMLSDGHLHAIVAGGQHIRSPQRE